MQKRYWLLFWLLLAVSLRLSYLNWGFPETFHIDEETIVVFTQQLTSTWEKTHRLINPSSSWGNLLFVVLGLAGRLCGFLKKAFVSERLFLIFVGRTIAASLSFLALGVGYQLARRLYDEKVALLSLAFNAVAVILIQQAHFYTQEIFLYFLTVLCLLWGEKILRQGRGRDYLGASLWLGLCLSVKITGALIGLPLLYAHYARVRQQRERFWQRRLLYILAAPLLYLLLNPGIWQGYAQRQIAGTTDVFWVIRQEYGLVKPSWTLHFEGLPLYWYELSHNFWFGLGPALELTLLLGVGWGLKRRRVQDVYLLSWLLPFYLLIGGWRTKYIRYIVSLVPFGLILGADFWVEIYQKIQRGRLLYWLLLGVTLTSSLLYAVAFTNIYAGPDSRSIAYQWATENVPEGATLLLERDESLRLVFNKPGVKVNWVDREELYYRLSGEAKIPYLAQKLETADYLIIGETNKMRYLHLPNLNPVEYLYYTLLDSGALGFEKVREYKIAPYLGSWEIDDDAAEQSFHLFDHPRVAIYRKVKTLPVKDILRQQLFARFPSASF